LEKLLRILPGNLIRIKSKKFSQAAYLEEKSRQKNIVSNKIRIHPEKCFLGWILLFQHLFAPQDVMVMLSKASAEEVTSE
jgi:hypothetical protein